MILRAHNYIPGIWASLFIMVLNACHTTQLQKVKKNAKEPHNLDASIFLSSEFCPIDCPLGLGDENVTGCNNKVISDEIKVIQPQIKAPTPARQMQFEHSLHPCKNSLPFEPEDSSKSAKPLKVLLIDTDSAAFQGVATFIPLFVEGLKAKSWHVVNPNRDLIGPDFLLDIQRKIGSEHPPDIVAFYMLRNATLDKWQNLSSLLALKVLIVEDLNFPHDIEPLQRSYPWMDVIFSRYPEHMMHFIDKTRLKSCYVFPHAASQAYFASFSNSKERKALVSGASGDGWYPLREKALQIVSSGKPSELVALKHPGYTVKVEPAEGAAAYARTLASYDIAIAGGPFPNKTFGPYIIAKHFEIPATGTVMLADKLYIPFLQKLGMIENAHYIATDPQNLEATVSYWLHPQRKEELSIISKQGRDLVNKCHRIEDRIELFDRIVIQEYLSSNY